MAVMALGAPSLVRNRRYCAPRYVRLRIKVTAAIRRAVAARLITRRVARPKTLSPLTRLSGHKPNHEAK
jgi:hypothetical protein